MLSISHLKHWQSVNWQPELNSLVSGFGFIASQFISHLEAFEEEQQPHRNEPRFNGILKHGPPSVAMPGHRLNPPQQCQSNSQSEVFSLG